MTIKHITKKKQRKQTQTDAKTNTKANKKTLDVMRSYRSSKSDQSKRRVERIKVMTALKILRHHQ